MSKKLKIAIIGSRGYPYVYSGYETLVKELSERLVKSGSEVTVYCHRKLFNKRPKKLNGINLVYTPSINSKIFSQLYNSFFHLYMCVFSKIDVVLVVNSANGPFGLITKIFRKKHVLMLMDWSGSDQNGREQVRYILELHQNCLLFLIKLLLTPEMNRIYNKEFKKNSSVIAYGSTMTGSKNYKILEKFNLLKKILFNCRKINS